jgi:hypothetical protein
MISVCQRFAAGLQNGRRNTIGIIIPHLGYLSCLAELISGEYGLLPLHIIVLIKGYHTLNWQNDDKVKQQSKTMMNTGVSIPVDGNNFSCQPVPDGLII